MNHIYWLSQLKSSEQSLVGEKVLTLSHLLQSGCPVLPGYVIGTPVLKEFLQTLDDSQSLIGNLSDSSIHVDVDNYQVLQSFAQKSRQVILEAEFPLHWQEAIFDSAQQLNSPVLMLRPSLVIPYYLKRRHLGLWNSHVCLCQPEAISLGIKRVWGELFSAKSIFYWQKVGINIDKLNLAILVQPLQDAIASGIVEIAADFIQIQASWGLGHSLLRGEVQPDIYEIERKTAAIKSKQLGNKIIAYHLGAESEKTKITSTCLQTEMVGEQEQEQYALTDTAVANLVQLVEEVVSTNPKIKYMEWTLPSDLYTQKSDRPVAETQFFLTQLNYFPATTTALFSAPSCSGNFLQPCLTGLAAAPGIVTAPIFLLKNNLNGNFTKPFPISGNLQEIARGSILVTEKIMPEHISLLPHVVGLITQEEGIASHGAIVARELNIPAIVGVNGATKILRSGDFILLNGNNGEIYRVSEAEMKQQQIQQQRTAQTTLAANLPEAFSGYPIATQLMVNLSQPSSISTAADLPVDGVGLIRSELMLADLVYSQVSDKWLDSSQQSKLQENLTNLLRQVARAFLPRPIYYRSFNCQSGNSWLGSTGTYRHWQDSTLFSLELEALARVMKEGYDNFNLILPFVRSVEEFSFCHRLVENFGFKEYPYFQIWIMAEVPSVLFLLPEYVRAGVQGIAIGTNDLAQLLLGIDRGQDHFARKGLHGNHPAMLKAIAQLIKSAKAEGIPCSICGQAPVQYPTLIDKLIKWGITSISVEPQALAKTYRAIARAEQRLLLSRVRLD